jgi:hypothetical protein
MPDNPPVDFQERVRRSPGSSSNEYPYSIKASDLMQNFVFATLEVDPSLVEVQTGSGGHAQRRLLIPAIPLDGIYVLGAVRGTMQWIATESCD